MEAPRRGRTTPLKRQHRRRAQRVPESTARAFGTHQVTLLGTHAAQWHPSADWPTAPPVWPPHVLQGAPAAEQGVQAAEPPPLEKVSTGQMVGVQLVPRKAQPGGAPVHSQPAVYGACTANIPAVWGGVGHHRHVASSPMSLAE